LTNRPNCSWQSGEPTNQPNRNEWACSDKQKALILKIVDENKLDKQEAEALANDMFQTPVKVLNKLQASGLIEQLLEKYAEKRAPAAEAIVRTRVEHGDDRCSRQSRLPVRRKFRSKTVFNEIIDKAIRAISPSHSPLTRRKTNSPFKNICEAWPYINFGPSLADTGAERDILAPCEPIFFGYFLFF
jgi:hypothetical protein